MARAPDPRIDQAKELYLAGKKLIEIARQLDLPEGTVRRWKCTHKWDKADTERSERKGGKKSERSDKKGKRKRGAQPGNKNSSGGPPGNKKAVKTGEFETLLFDCLDEDEKRLIANTPENKQRLLLQEIGLLSVRERRMLKRIEAIKGTMEYLDNGMVVEGMTLVSRKYGTEKDKETDLKEYQGKLGQIQSIEEALTRVQARKQRAIESLHKFGYDDSQISLETKRVELAARVSGEIEESEEPDDGFLEALKASVNGDWEGWGNGTENKETSDI